MTVASISAYLPLADLVKILVVALTVAVVAPSAVSLAIAGDSRRRAGSIALGNSLISLGGLILLVLVMLGLYALIDR